MGGLTQAQINAKKTAINGHLDHLGCQSWNNAFGFNGKPGNYVPSPRDRPDHGRMAPVGAPRNNCLLPAALVYDPVTNPKARVVATRTWPRRCGARPRASRPAVYAPARRSTTWASSTA